MSAERVDGMLRASAASQIETESGRVAARVRARMAVKPTSAPAVSYGRWQGLGSLLAACAIIGATWLAIGTNHPSRAANEYPIVKLTAALDRSATTIRAAKIEQPMMTEARRLKDELKRGVGFVKSVMPRVRVSG